MAKQRVIAGGTIDVATSEEIEALVKALTAKRADEYRREKGVIGLNASGVGVDRSIKASSRYDWWIDRVTLTGANATFSIFENDELSLTNLLFVAQLGTAGLYSDGASNSIYIPANTQLVIAVTGGPANGQGTYNIQGHFVDPGIAR